MASAAVRSISLPRPMSASTGPLALWPEFARPAPLAREALEADALYSGYLARQEADIVALRKDETLDPAGRSSTTRPSRAFRRNCARSSSASGRHRSVRRRASTA